MIITYYYRRKPNHTYTIHQYLASMLITNPNQKKERRKIKIKIKYTP